ncbi:phosphotransferase [Streptomyces sp. NPDC102360]|uniref:phosphotransferase n=1 Tax=Streptomyces sp. NPDC102360 TaxID=3366160 RepID=UPI00382945F3
MFCDGVPSAFIDFDTAAPGDPLEDLGYMAWTWCISFKPTAPPATAQAAQVRTLTDAYGLDAASRAHVLDAALTRQLRNADWWRTHLTSPPHTSRPPPKSTHASTGPPKNTPTRQPTAIPSRRPSTDRAGSDPRGNAALPLEL